MRICGEGGNFSLRKKVPSLPCPLPPSKTAHTSTRKPSWPAGPEGFLVEGACRPTLSVMPYPEIFLSASPSARPACAQKQNTCARQAFDIRAVHRRTTMGTGTQFREKYFGDWMGDWEKEGQLLQKRPFLSPSQHSDKIHAPILTADRHPAFMHLTTNGAITVSDVGAVRPKPPGSASRGLLLFSCGCLTRACTMARAVLALPHS